MNEELKQENSKDFGLPKFGTKQFNDLASTLFGGKPKQENCCTPVGQIKRYVDCHGCDRKPKQEQEVCNHCGKTLREQMKGCGEITCYRQFLTKKETLEERETYWDLADAKAEQNNTIDLDAYAEGVQDGVKWMQERMYSEKEVESLLHKYMQSQIPDWHGWSTTKWFEQFKKK